MVNEEMGQSQSITCGKINARTRTGNTENGKGGKKGRVLYNEGSRQLYAGSEKIGFEKTRGRQILSLRSVPQKTLTHSTHKHTHQQKLTHTLDKRSNKKKTPKIRPPHHPSPHIPRPPTHHNLSCLHTGKRESTKETKTKEGKTKKEEGRKEGALVS